MCLCTPTKRTPFCGRPGCIWPISGEAMPSALDMALEVQPAREPDGSQVWYAVSTPGALRGQPMALFRLASDAQLVGGRMTLGDIEITAVSIQLPPGLPQPDAPKPSVTVLVSGVEAAPTQDF